MMQCADGFDQPSAGSHRVDIAATVSAVDASRREGRAKLRKNNREIIV
jgi:hypothetical protein